MIRPTGVAGTWKTDIETGGTFELSRHDIPNPRAPDHRFAWHEYRRWALETCSAWRGWLFRGHRLSSYPLLTTFHRTGRRDLFRYDAEDVPRLHRHVEATLGKRYDAQTSPLEYGALLSLAQHHGFPTPLLDFTASPFVAASFAFSGVPKEAKSQEPYVRIFAFDSGSWPFHELHSIVQVGLKFSQRLLHARDNPRALPQQSVSMFSNIVDIENYVAFQEEQAKKRLLLRIDISTAERPTAMRELSTMGITAASLFPGLEGACKALAEEWF